MFEEGGESRESRPFQFKERPVKVGDVLDVTITGLGKEGDGFAKVSGFIIFVPNSKKGEHLRVRVVKVLRSYAFAEKIEE